MNANPYSKQQRHAMEVGAPENVEAWALIQLAHRLDQVRKDPNDQEKLRETVRLNWRIWTIFQAELSSAESKVSKEIRENLLSLSNFIDKRSMEIIAERKDIDIKKLDVLININRHIGNGLLGNRENDGDVPIDDMIEKITEKNQAITPPPPDQHTTDDGTTDLKI
jgi:flagellar protein FlaF